MTESEVRKLLRQMKELDSQTAFRDFYNMTYDRLFRIAYYYVKQEEWSQEIVLSSAKLLSFLVCKRGGPAWPPLAGYFFRLLTFRKIRPPMMNTTSAMAIIAFSSIKSFLLTQIQTAVILRYGCPFCACPHRPQRPGRQRP